SANNREPPPSAHPRRDHPSRSNQACSRMWPVKFRKSSKRFDARVLVVDPASAGFFMITGCGGIRACRAADRPSFWGSVVDLGRDVSGTRDRLERSNPALSARYSIYHIEIQL